MEETNNNSTPTPTKGSRTGVVVAFVVVILVIAGALWYSFSGTNDNTNNTNKVMSENTNVTVNTNTTTNTNSAVDTSDWETYTNEEYGISIQYPFEWEVSKYEDSVYFSPPEIQDSVFLISRISGGIDEVVNYVNTIQNHRVDEINSIITNGINAKEIFVTHTSVDQQYRNLTIEFDDYSLYMPYKANPDTGFPTSLEYQKIIDVMHSTLMITQ
ncbi:hypothetical protein KKB10_01540 [Patescibacteria group bacterium]|nr:hypothetical protein [Patescibacteria group bacterium]MBU1951298.1 hypothetical protein [Patescibacteria group bacterium]MBU2229323.1 hypothetical protein [Patescibacteria group bacterium]